MPHEIILKINQKLEKVIIFNIFFKTKLQKCLDMVYYISKIFIIAKVNIVLVNKFVFAIGMWLHWVILNV